MLSSVWKVRVALELLIMQWMYPWCKPRETYLFRNGFLPLSDVLLLRFLTSPQYTCILILWWMAAVLLLLPACRPSPFSLCALRWRGAACCILLHSPHYAVFWNVVCRCDADLATVPQVVKFHTIWTYFAPICCGWFWLNSVISGFRTCSMCVFCLDSTVVVLINWLHGPWTEVKAPSRAHSFSFHEPFSSGHTDNFIQVSHTLLPSTPRCGSSMCKFSLNHDLEWRKSWLVAKYCLRLLYEKFGYLFCDTSPTDNGKSTGILPACAMILSQLRLIESMV